MKPAISNRGIMKTTSKQYRDNYDKIFGSQVVEADRTQMSAQPNKKEKPQANREENPQTNEEALKTLREISLANSITPERKNAYKSETSEGLLKRIRNVFSILFS